jgi:hypothetical protein
MFAFASTHCSDALGDARPTTKRPKEGWPSLGAKGPRDGPKSRYLPEQELRDARTNIDWILDLLEQRGPLTSRDLAHITGIDHKVVAATLRRARQHGRVTAEVDPDLGPGEVKRTRSWFTPWSLISRVGTVAFKRKPAERTRPTLGCSTGARRAAVHLELAFTPRLRDTLNLLHSHSRSSVVLTLDPPHPKRKGATKRGKSASPDPSTTFANRGGSITHEVERRTHPSGVLVRGEVQALRTSTCQVELDFGSPRITNHGRT